MMKSLQISRGLEKFCKNYLTVVLVLILFGFVSQIEAQTNVDTIYDCDVTDATTVGGNDGFVILNVTGLESPIDYSWETAPPIYGQAATSLHRGVYFVEVTDANGYTDTAQCAVGEPYVSCYGLRTQTQGGWGQKARGNNPGSYRDANFHLAFPSGLTIGCDNGGYTLHLNSASDVKAFLPSGKTPKALTQDLTDPGRSYRNVLAGQVAALSLNVGFDSYDDNFASADFPLHAQEIADGTFSGWTVQDLLDEANFLLGGCSSPYTYSEMNHAVTKVNENFVNMKRTGGYLNCSVYLGSSIGDYVYIDENGDGGHNPGETGIAGVSLTLEYAGLDGIWNTGDDETFSTTTNDLGVYDFTGLEGGEYRVEIDQVTLPAGLVLTAGTDPKYVTLYSDHDFNNADFGYQLRNSSIAGNVFTDIFGDGVKDGSDSGIEGVELLLTGSGPDGILGTGDDLSQNQTTDADGNYLFDDLPAGEYAVQVGTGVPSDHTLSAGTDPSQVTLGANQDIVDVDFGYQPFTSSIGDNVFEDINGDGLKNGGDSDLDGVSVSLTEAGDDGVLGTGDDVAVGSQTTSGGSYLFENLPAGTYEVSVNTTSAPADYLESTQTSYTVTLAPDTDYLDADFGFQPFNSSIGDIVWEDTDGDQVQDGNEVGLGPVTVNLYTPGTDNTLGTSDDDLHSSTVTHGSGFYQFSNLAAGDYRVEVESGATTDGMVNSTAVYMDINLGVNQDVDNADFGFQPRDNTLTVDVWEDENEDCIRDGSEAALSGIDVDVTWHGADGILGTSDDELFSGTTDVSGVVLIEDLPDGDYTIDIVENSLPAGWLESGSCDSGAPVALGGTSTNNGGGGVGFNQPKGDIRGIVWDDLDGNGTRDAGEPLVSGITVELLDASGLSTGLSTTTDGSGLYSFAGLTPDDYKVRFSGLPVDYQFTIAGGDSKADRVTGETGANTVLGSQVTSDVDAGIALPGKIEMTVDVQTPFTPYIFSIYDPVTYTYTLINTGGVPIDGPTITEALCPPVYVSGDSDSDLKLDNNETWVLQCTRTYTWNPNTDYYITTAATCGADDVLGNNSIASANTIIYPFGINMDIMSDIGIACAGDTIEVKYVNRMIGSNLIEPGMDAQLIDVEISSNIINGGALWSAGPGSQYFSDPSGDYQNTLPGANGTALDIYDNSDEDNGNGFADWVHVYEYVVPAGHTGDIVITAYDVAKANMYDGSTWTQINDVRLGSDTLIIADGCPQAYQVSEEELENILNPDPDPDPDPDESNGNSQVAKTDNEDVRSIDIPAYQSRTTQVYETRLFPTVNSGQFNVSVSSEMENARLEIIDAHGKIVFTDKEINGLTKYDLSNLNPGRYWVRIIKGDQIEFEDLLKTK